MIKSFSKNLLYPFPDSPFFLRHVVAMNYAGKVYSVIRGIEIAATDIDDLNKALFISYAVFMALGMYWYTRFWSLKVDLEKYYNNDKSHALIRICKSNKIVTFFAAIYYALFCGLFTWSYVEINEPVALSFSIWNAWCCANLLLAIPWC